MAQTLTPVSSIPLTAGGSTGTFLPSGNLNVQISTAGINPGATGADNVVAFFSVPANFFDGVGNRGLTISASGSFAANGDAKTVKIIFNPSTAVVGSTVGASGTTVATTGSVTTSGGGWALQAFVYKVGAANSNTQISIHSQAQVGAAVSALLAPTTNITATENAAILIAVTANTTTATDVVFTFLEVNAVN